MRAVNTSNTLSTLSNMMISKVSNIDNIVDMLSSRIDNFIISIFKPKRHTLNSNRDIESTTLKHKSVTTNNHNRQSDTYNSDYVLDIDMRV